MQTIKKKQVKKEISNIIQVNHDFNDFLDSLNENYALDENHQKNTVLLKEHLNNMNVIFTQMSDNVK